MDHKHTDDSQRAGQNVLGGDAKASAALLLIPDRAGETIAALYACTACDAWWAGSDAGSLDTQLLFLLVEPYASRYLWADYRGWYHGVQALICANCGQTAAAAAFVLRRDERGQIVWPQEALPEQPAAAEATPQDQGDNPFLVYVSESALMAEAMAAIAAREAKYETYAWGYTANIEALRDAMAAQRNAFQHAVARYAPLLPPGWRITADYGKWVQGKACVGFLHGEVAPDISLLIGGECRTVTALEMELDRLLQYVVERDD